MTGFVVQGHICGFNNQMHLHLSRFIWNAAQTISWSGLSDRIYIRLECVSESIYTWSFHDRIAIPSEKTHEVTRCKQALNVGFIKLCVCTVYKSVHVTTGRRLHADCKRTVSVSSWKVGSSGRVILKEKWWKCESEWRGTMSSEVMGPDALGQVSRWIRTPRTAGARLRTRDTDPLSLLWVWSPDPPCTFCRPEAQINS